MTVKRRAYWADRTKPQVDYEIENFDRKSVDDYVGTLMDLAVLALQTDSTRAVTVQIPNGKASRNRTSAVTITTFPTTARSRKRSKNCSCWSTPSSSASARRSPP